MHINFVNKKIGELLAMFILFLIILVPVLVSAQDFIPCGGPGQHDCGYYDLLQLVNNIINWIIKISVPVAAGVFAWAGIKYMTTGIADQKSAAKEMLHKVFIGFVFILAAWIIVTTVTNTLLKDEFKKAVPVQGVK